MKVRNLLKRALVVILVFAMLAPVMGNSEANVKEVQAEEPTIDPNLNVKCQITQSPVQGSEIEKYNGKYVMRFVAVVDEYKDYQTLGFKIEFTTTEGETKKGTSVAQDVFKRIESTTGSYENEKGEIIKDTYTFSPKVVNTEGEYFVTVKLPIEASELDVNYTVWAYGISTDGEPVEGPRRTICARDGLSSNHNIDMTFAKKTGVEFDTVTAEINGTAYNADILKVDESTETVSVRIQNVNVALKSATVVTFKNNGVEVGKEIYRNLYTEYAGEADTSWYEQYLEVYPDATKFTIATDADLWGLAKLVNTGDADGVKQYFVDKEIYMVSDIKVNDGNASDWTATNKPTYPWTPIGTADSADYAFGGVFDGQGHQISGIYINTGANGAALFRATKVGTYIQNLSLTNSYIYSTKPRTGSIIGTGRGYFTNLYSDATVQSSAQWVGGIMGCSVATELERCWFNGTVTSTGSTGTGGIIGAIVNANVNLTSCLNSGEIDVSNNSSTTPKVGGLVGDFQGQNVLKIIGSLNTGKIKVGSDDTKCFGRILGNRANNLADFYGVAKGTQYTLYATNESLVRCDGDVETRIEENTTVKYNNSANIPTFYDEAEIKADAKNTLEYLDWDSLHWNWESGQLPTVNPHAVYDKLLESLEP